MFSSSVNSNFPRRRNPEVRHGSASGRKNIASVVLSTTIENEWEKLREVKLNYFRLPRGRPGFDSQTGRASSFLLSNDSSKSFTRCHKKSSALTSARVQWNALAGNRTRVNCLEGSYACHYTTNAFGGCFLARTVKMIKLEAHESLIGLLELKRSFFEPKPKESMSSVWIPSHTRKLCLSRLAK